MCDCYQHGCKVCKFEIPIHLGDFETSRDEIDVFCNEHIPSDNVRVFVLKKKENENKYLDSGNKWRRLEVLTFAKGYKIGIRDLTDNARTNAEDNHPNLLNAEEIK